ncbi:MAG TPA: DUF1801 domain-containing protein [Candidatus Kapabacteria bacterium]|nr:DUF1801 domain-containing protein [Candidatus Kapabacteria bacterium]
MKADNKTIKTNRDVAQYIDSLGDSKKIEDCNLLIDIMKDVSKCEPKMWGESIIGFGDYTYKYESGREGDWFYIGIAPRKQNITIYMMSGFDKFEEYLAQIGKYKMGKSCLYIKKIEDINLDILKIMLELAITHLKKLYP